MGLGQTERAWPLGSREEEMPGWGTGEGPNTVAILNGCTEVPVRTARVLP